MWASAMDGAVSSKDISRTLAARVVGDIRAADGFFPKYRA